MSCRDVIRKAQFVFLVAFAIESCLPVRRIQPLNASELMHGKDWSGQRVGGWLMQEKLDGLRCLWTGRELVSRNGEKFNAPAWFTAGLPIGVPLDGELFAGYGSLGGISNTLARHKSGADCDWKGVRFMVFDAPAFGDDFDVFEYRSSTLEDFVFAAPHADSIPTRRVVSLAKLRRELKALHKRGGEGFILRDPNALYVAGRTDKVLKFKAEYLY